MISHPDDVPKTISDVKDSEKVSTMKTCCYVLYGRKGLCSRRTAWVKSFGSKQILNFPFCLGATTIDEIHRVGLETGARPT